MLGSVALLVVSSFIALPAVHFFAQLLIVVLVIGWPLFFHQRWVALFSGSEQKNTLPQYLNGFSLLLVSLAAAVVVVGLTNGVTTRTGELPQKIILAAVNLPEGVSANFGNNNGVRVIVTAPRDVWSSLKSDNFSAIVDTSSQGEGTYDLPVTVSTKLSSVKIIRVNPSRAIVTVEPVIRKTLPVAVKFSGKAGNELVPDEPILTPNKVEISGPKSVVTDLTQASVQLRLNGETAPIKTKLTVAALNGEGEIIGGLSFSPAEIDTTVNLVKAGQLKTVGIKAVVSGQPASGFWVKNISVTPPVVTITGPADVLDSVSSILTSSASVAGLSSTTTISATLVLPSGVTLSDDIKKVDLKVELSAITTTKTLNPEISYDGLSASLKVSLINPTSVSAIVSADAGVLNALAAGSVKLKLNLAAYKSAGVYSVAISNTDFVLPDGVGLVSFLPSAIEVTLENR